MGDMGETVGTVMVGTPTTVGTVMVGTPTREVMIQAEAVVLAVTVAVITVAAEVAVVVEVVNHLTRFGSPFHVMMECVVF